MEQKRINRKHLIRKIIKIVIILLLVFGARYFFEDDTKSSKELKALVIKYNAACPVMISNDIRMESVNTLPHNTIQYDFTLVNVQKESINVEALQKNVESEILATSKTNPSLNAFRDNGSTVIYNYKDIGNQDLFQVVLTPETY